MKKILITFLLLALTACVPATRPGKTDDTRSLSADFTLPASAQRTKVGTLQDAPLVQGGLYQSSYFGVMPARGQVHVPVFLIDFPEYPGTTTMQQEVETVFFGEAAETGWQSLSSFYYESSGGALKITGTVFPWLRSPFTYAELGKNNALGMGYMDQLITHVLLQYYAQGYDFSQFDADFDGVMDALYFVYSAPVNYNSNYWAYRSWYCLTSTTCRNVAYNNVLPYGYVWIGYDFLQYRATSGRSGLNGEALIHETGHLLGLDDYYDYEEETGPAGGLGLADMMDGNIGDHGPVSKILLGWEEPIILDGSEKEVKITLSPSNNLNQVIMISPTFADSIFGEVLLIDYFQPTGLNGRLNEVLGLQSGIRIYQVDATLFNYGGAYNFRNDNSYSTNKFVRYIENGGILKVQQGKNLAPSALFTQGDILGTWQYKKFPWYKSEYKNKRLEIEIDAIRPAFANLIIRFSF